LKCTAKKKKVQKTKAWGLKCLECNKVSASVVEIPKKKLVLPKKQVNLEKGFKIDANPGSTANPKVCNSTVKDVKS